MENTRIKLQKFKKAILTCSLVALITTNSVGAGIPVIDAGAIAQAVMQYSQMIKQYEQMIKDTLNFEKQMKELGVDMNSIGDILGEAYKIINETQSLYNNIKAIPDEFYGEVSDIIRACSFMEKQSTFFQIKIKKVNNKYQDRINACISSISDSTQIFETLEELAEKAQSITDPTILKEIQIEMENIAKAQKYMQNKANQERVSTMLSFYDNLNKNELNNPYTKAKMDKDLQELSRQLAKPNNTKQAQALTNSILLKVLEMTQKQYELNVNFASTMATFKNSENQNNGKIDYEKKYIETINPKEFNPFYQNIDSNLPKDTFGLPQYNIK